MRLNPVLLSMALAGLMLTRPAAAQQPVQVFILAGQSNMQGKGWYNDRTPTNGIDEPGTLQKLIDNDPSGTYDYLQSSPGNYITRSDVSIFTTDGNRSGGLSVGYGTDASMIGPELGFGWQVGDALSENVLIIKTCWGGKSLAVDFRPPSAVLKRGGAVGFYYNEILNTVDSVLSNIGAYVPGYAGQGYQIKGFGWHQGWNDRVTAPFVAEYEENLVDFINDIRFDLAASDLPFVIANTGMEPPLSGNALTLANAQLAVDELTGTHPVTNVRAIDTTGFWRDASLSPVSQGYHWNQNGETMFLMGDAMGTQMVTMSSYVQFARPYIEVDQQTGEIRLVNPNTNLQDMDLKAYSITSASGALDAANWIAITGNYDAAGDSSIDTGNWTVTSSATDELSELAVPGGADGLLTMGSEITLGVGTWIQNLHKDLYATYTDTDGTVWRLNVRYLGFDNILADLTTDGTIDVADWAQFVAGMQMDMSGLSAAQAYQRGDLDGDFDNDIDDFDLFRRAYEQQHPQAGAFQAMLAAYQVPEPASLLLLGLGAAGMAGRRRGCR